MELLFAQSLKWERERAAHQRKRKDYDESLNRVFYSFRNFPPIECSGRSSISGSSRPCLFYARSMGFRAPPLSPRFRFRELLSRFFSFFFVLPSITEQSLNSSSDCTHWFRKLRSWRSFRRFFTISQDVDGSSLVTIYSQRTSLQRVR